MSWIYRYNEINELPHDCAGFVYEITNLLTGRKYIGKKVATFTRTTIKTVTLKDGTKKKKRVRVTKSSDWQEYWGSCHELTEDIKQYGESKFRREILHFCTTRAMCSYLEAKEQFISGALESDRYYNNSIMVRVHGSHVKKKPI